MPTWLRAAGAIATDLRSLPPSSSHEGRRQTTAASLSRCATAPRGRHKCASDSAPCRRRTAPSPMARATVLTAGTRATMVGLFAAPLLQWIGTFWENLQTSLKEAGGPRGAQGAISWLFLPGLFTGFAFGIEPLYLLGYTALFIFAFTGMEMAKPTPYTAYEPVMGRGKK
eukprot:SM000014S00362  [mRNA]  locus=s14:901553:902513:+ [translate_table: standard]